MEYSVGKPISSWGDGKAQTITFVVTEDCNLQCKYCYITHKNSHNRMTIETAKKCVDFMLEGTFNRAEAVIIEFIGGEPFLEIDLIDQICDYFKIRSYQLQSDWYWNYRISICTNGINFLDERVQNFLDKNVGKVSCNITVDGTKEKHDLNRVFANGKGSFENIKKSLPNYIERGFITTKVTFSSDDLIYLFDSIVYLWSIGIKEIAANVVFENVWKEGDDTLFEEQIKRLADYIIDNHIFEDFKCTLFDDTIGYGYSDKNITETFCGAGRMMAFDCNGDIYPCIRYKGYSLNNQPPRIVGNIYTGIDMEKIRPFELSQVQYQSDKECLNCPVATGCGFCQGLNYDESEVGTNFYRAKNICKMHKARVRGNNYYFAKLFNQYGITKNNQGKRRYMFFLLDDNFTDYCCEHNYLDEDKKMSAETIEQGLKWCEEYFYHPVFVHSSSEYPVSPMENEFVITHLAYYTNNNNSLKNKKTVYCFDEHNYRDLKNEFYESVILTIDSSNINQLSEIVNTLWKRCERINLYLKNLTSSFNFEEYENQLSIIITIINEFKKNNETIKEINVLTDSLISEDCGCGAGNQSLTLAPDGNIYPCVGFYLRNEKQFIFREEDLLSYYGKRRLFLPANNPLCSKCKANNCVKCVSINQLYTGEPCVSPSFQCKKGVMEFNKSLEIWDLVSCNKENEQCVDPFYNVANDTIGIYL